MFSLAVGWTPPVSEIAARLGVSDVALAKLCRRAAIPKRPQDTLRLYVIAHNILT
jgi:hypothetical protein